MTEEEVTAAEEHAKLDAQQDRESAVKTFLVDFVRSTPTRAVVFARNADEARRKFEKREVEEYDEEELDSWTEVTDVVEVSE